MKREIKFRIPMFSDKGHFIEFQYLKLGDDVEGTLCGHNGEPQQYTGLEDKNGKNCYEGDIVKISEGVHYGKLGEDCRDEVVFVGGMFCLKGFGELLTGFTFEIIGNISENPEFLC